MKNIMVCVTKQKTCQRLIDFGKEQKESEEDQLFVIHVTGKDIDILGNTEEGAALEFLYEKAKKAGASLTVEKSDNVLATLANLVEENKITQIIVGETGEQNEKENFLDRFMEVIHDQAQFMIVPSNS